MVIDLTGMEVANASLLDEATAAAEGMTLCKRVLGAKAEGAPCSSSRGLSPADHRRGEDARRATRHPGRGRSAESCDFGRPFFGALLQYPATDGEIRDYAPFCERAHGAGVLVVVATDLLALALLRPPAEFGADVVVGNSQRFGVPLNYGGPHAAFMATREEYKRSLPGRIVGVSKDAEGHPRSASRCRRASSTSVARRPPATSARRRCCSR
jgi:glycine dehydrogenase